MGGGSSGWVRHARTGGDGPRKPGAQGATWTAWKTTKSKTDEFGATGRGSSGHLLDEMTPSGRQRSQEAKRGNVRFMCVGGQRRGNDKYVGWSEAEWSGKNGHCDPWVFPTTEDPASSLSVMLFGIPTSSQAPRWAAGIQCPQSPACVGAAATARRADSSTPGSERWSTCPPGRRCNAVHSVSTPLCCDGALTSTRRVVYQTSQSVNPAT